MFNLFPFNFNQIFNYTNPNSGVNFSSFISFTSGIGQNQFDFMNKAQFSDEFRNLISDFIGGVDFEKIYSEYNKALNDINEELIENEECRFIEFQEFQDMYLLKIDLTGIDLRELSIRYDPGIINIRLKKSELDKPVSFLGYVDQKIIKKDYSKTFDNIEDIDISRVYKKIDNGIYTLNMPKKYMIDSGERIIDIENYSVEPNKTEIIEVKKEKEEY
ncbi:Hsp20/alpha crystallin family protein [Clostridium sp. SM-530-WT-3G]|uniref:Hsp20/alpha crystallin family protein n=1 Tax=Clostridium sp. SM-530-WT-3G TaxID=2725303 RepID=UPI00145FC232|nr:Hsp20/alpha crystallin family protein [Clostridium sp. SM-530-WT-3G]NME83890.1 Hsp20/alpha crystallin family protein [Clostridium sp. SM-530-WT-3G]